MCTNETKGLGKTVFGIIISLWFSVENSVMHPFSHQFRSIVAYLHQVEKWKRFFSGTDNAINMQNNILHEIAEWDKFFFWFYFCRKIVNDWNEKCTRHAKHLGVWRIPFFRIWDDNRSEVHSNILRDTQNAVNLIRRSKTKKKQQQSVEYILYCMKDTRKRSKSHWDKSRVETLNQPKTEHSSNAKQRKTAKERRKKNFVISATNKDFRCHEYNYGCCWCFLFSFILSAFFVIRFFVWLHLILPSASKRWHNSF